MRFTIRLNQSALNRLNEGAKLAIGATAEALKTEVVQAQVVPFDVGTLQDSMDVDRSNVDNGKAKITMDTPYARRLYFHPEYNFRKTNNANAKGKWFEDWLPGGANEQFAQEAFASLYRQYTGGIVR